VQALDNLSVSRGAVFRYDITLRERPPACYLLSISLFLFCIGEERPVGGDAHVFFSYFEAHADILASLFCSEEKVEVSYTRFHFFDSHQYYSLSLFWICQELGTPTNMV
jgi:hypothetical protein